MIVIKSLLVSSCKPLGEFSNNILPKTILQVN